MKTVIILFSVLLSLAAAFESFAQTLTEASEEQFASAETINTGNKVTRRLEAGNADWYRIYVKKSGTLVFETTVTADTDPDTDVDMELYYESEGNRLLAVLAPIMPKNDKALIHRKIVSLSKISGYKK